MKLENETKKKEKKIDRTRAIKRQVSLTLVPIRSNKGKGKESFAQKQIPWLIKKKWDLFKSSSFQTNRKKRSVYPAFIESIFIWNRNR